MTPASCYRAMAFLVLAVVGGALLGGCASSGTHGSVEAAPPIDPGQVMRGDYLIGVDDRIQVSVWKNPDLSVTVPVRPDGKISVPLAGDVQAGGKTPTDVAESIRQKLSVYVRDPSVSVIVAELRSHEFISRIRVTGAVRTPRTFPYRQGMTVLDAVLEAGGVNDFASPNRTKLYRRTGEKSEVIDIDLGDILNKGELQTNLLLRPGDVITIPERLF